MSDLYIQWKGTDVCCDIHCDCGAHLHFDGFFMYAFRCPECKQLYEVADHVPITPVDSTDRVTVDIEAEELE